ncbi:TIGR03086 family metal-binding protein [Nocardioides cynanchi]|uniref:TIGR03086 family metal-binding protein n=1 Tax=Nocardioides cynanchi TaxID=2558918 RepID=UPI0012464EE6|nr:TIGR03086 family metal-binding protein [Nocardioides cynanchi]
MDVGTLYRRTVAGWTDRVGAVGPDQWGDPTPCTAWTVRDLVNHVVGEDRWTVPLMRGLTIEEVGTSLDGDLLGDDPVARARTAAAEAVAVVAELLPSGGTVHLSYGEEQMAEYVHQLAADHLVHAWDLAAATGGDTALDDDLVAEVAGWYAERAPLYRGAGMVGPRGVSRGGAAGDFLADFGRDAAWGPTHAALARFSAAFGRGDVDEIMGLMTQDCIFESTGPAPDGEKHEGAAEVRVMWEELFNDAHRPSFTEEESFVSGDRAVLRWLLQWTEDDGSPGHVRGVDVMRLRDGLVYEKLSYVKG